MEDGYIIGFDKMPNCTYVEHNETITQLAFPSSLVPNASWLKTGDNLLINSKSYIIKDRIDLMGYVILKCKEEE